MSKPILHNTASYAFDAVKDREFTFQYSGSQAFSNTLIIRRNDTYETVYNASQTTMQLKHTLPANTLTNGTLYNVSIYVTDRDGNNSDISEPLIFCCYSTPEFAINITENQIIGDSSYNVVIAYTQTEDEALQSYQVILYDQSKQVIYSSSTRYDTALLVPISGLENNTTYYIRATGETINHMSLDTGYVKFTVKYILPSYYSYLVSENDRRAGTILLSSFYVSIEGRTLDGSIPIFSEEDLVDTVNGSGIIFDHGFRVDNDFIMRLCFYPCGRNVSPLKLSNGLLDIILTERRGVYWNTDGEKLYYELSIKSGKTYYIIKSEYVDVPDDTDVLYLWIKKKGNLYELHLISIKTALWGNIDSYTWEDLSDYTWENIKRITSNGKNSTLWDELNRFTWNDVQSNTWDNIRRKTSGENYKL